MGGQKTTETAPSGNLKSFFLFAPWAILALIVVGGALAQNGGNLASGCAAELSSLENECRRLYDDAEYAACLAEVESLSRACYEQVERAARPYYIGGGFSFFLALSVNLATLYLYLLRRDSLPLSVARLGLAAVILSGGWWLLAIGVALWALGRFLG